MSKELEISKYEDIIDAEIVSKFYQYSQNNSGGRFHEDASAGITHFVIIEAENIAHANSRAEEIGLYFDGSGDCECCGSRWSEKYEWDDFDDSDPVPSLYTVDVSSGIYVPDHYIPWTKVEAYIHYLDGRVVPVIARKKLAAGVQKPELGV